MNHCGRPEEEKKCCRAPGELHEWECKKDPRFSEKPILEEPTKDASRAVKGNIIDAKEPTQNLSNISVPHKVPLERTGIPDAEEPTTIEKHCPKCIVKDGVEFGSVENGKVKLTGGDGCSNTKCVCHFDAEEWEREFDEKFTPYIDSTWKIQELKSFIRSLLEQARNEAYAVGYEHCEHGASCQCQTYTTASSTPVQSVEERLKEAIAPFSKECELYLVPNIDKTNKCWAIERVTGEVLAFITAEVQKAEERGIEIGENNKKFDIALMREEKMEREIGARVERSRIEKAVGECMDDYFKGLLVIPFPQATYAVLKATILKIIKGEV